MIKKVPNMPGVCLASFFYKKLRDLFYCSGGDRGIIPLERV